MSSPQRSPRDLINDLLEGGYQEASRGVLAAIAAESRGDTALAARLADLDAEAARLAEAGELLSPDNPVLDALLEEIDRSQAQNIERIRAASGTLSEEGVNAASDISQLLTLSGTSGNTRLRLEAAWNRPDPQAVAALVDFTNDPAFADLMAKYRGLPVERILARARLNFINGRGARASARDIAQRAGNVAVSQAETIMRTLHANAYRRGTAATHAANAQILQPETIRVAVLDFRTCLACVALHGRRYPLGEPVEDHYNGRCTMIAVVRGFERRITSGVDWFNSLSPERQRAQRAFANNPSYWRAWDDGAVQLEDFVQRGSDPVFGEQVTQASLAGILGSDAQRYYS